jgi:phospholipid transport system substrate-binding protein
MTVPLRVLVTTGLAFLVIGLEAPPVARAGPPTDYLRTRIDKLYDLLGGVGPSQASPERQAAARGVLDEMFDWPEMAKRSLGKYWGERSEGERTEFQRLFSELFQRTYLSRIQLADRERFEYLGDANDGDRTVVRTKVYTKQDGRSRWPNRPRPARAK